MRKSVFSALAVLAVTASIGVAASQVVPETPQVAPPTATQPAGEAAPAAAPQSAELSDEDKTATPLPPGRHAALVKKVCVDCHSAKPILDLRYTREDAENLYKNMVSTDLTTDQAKNIIEYLTTTLAP